MSATQIPVVAMAIQDDSEELKRDLDYKDLNLDSLSSLTRVDRRPTSGSVTVSERRTIEAAIPGQPLREFISILGKRIRWEKVKLCSLGLSAFAGGWNDACAGALIPWMEIYYSINYAQVASIFIGFFVGFAISGSIINFLNDRYGVGRVATCGAALMLVGYSILIAPPPFPLFPICYVIIGLGVALGMGITASWTSTLDNASVKINAIQAMYGFGALFSPLAATAMTSRGIKFSHFYALSLALSVLNTTSMFMTFFRDPQHRPVPTVPATQGQPIDANAVELNGINRLANPTTDVFVSTAAKNKAMLKNKTTLLTSLFLMCYVGAEVALGGWCVSFLIHSRGGDPKSAGYVSSGFWAAITLGRLTLPRLYRVLPEKWSIIIFSSLAIVFQITTWVVKDLIENAVAICIVGFLLSCFYGTLITNAAAVLPKHLRVGSFGIMAASGQAGSALYPFMVGALADKYGPVVLNPMVIILCMAMNGLWLVIPKVSKSR